MEEGDDIRARSVRGYRRVSRARALWIVSPVATGCAVPIPSNIAEGQGRRLPRDFRAFLRRARGSLHEVETQLLLSSEFGYISPEKTKHLLELSAELGRIINGLIASLAGDD
jgi:four helix bundle protein